MGEIWLECPFCRADVSVDEDIATGRMVAINERECGNDPYKLCYVDDHELLERLNADLTRFDRRL